MSTRILTIQIGGGIVFDSDPYDEWMETMNKLGANMQCISSAEQIYLRMQSKDSAAKDIVETEALGASKSSPKAHIDLAAG
jgi:anthranilate synthase component 1